MLISKLLWRFYHSSKGAATVEFTLTIVFFLVFLLAFLEFCRMGVLGGCMDWAVSQSAKEVKNDKSVVDYEQAFSSQVKQNLSVMGMCRFVDNSKVNVQVDYFNSPADIASWRVASSGGTSNAKLAVYNINYVYKPLFGPFVPNLLTDLLFQRNVAVVQEYKR